MALINCPECKKEISDKALACPHCGFPVKEVSSSAKSSDRFWKIIAVSTLVLYVVLGVFGIWGFFTIKKALSDINVSQFGNMEQILQMLTPEGPTGGNSEQMESLMKQMLEGDGMEGALQLLLQGNQ